MLRKVLYITLMFFGFTLSAQEVIKTMFYNLLEFPSALPGSRAEILRNVLNEYEPDIFMVCELENEVGADLILNISLNDGDGLYSRAPFVLNQSGSSNLQQLLYFRTGMFTLESSEVITTNIRDINRYRLKLSTADGTTNPVFLEVFVTHLKSSQGSSNEAQRLDMVTAFTDFLSTIDPNTYVIFAGDLNLYDANEPAYQELLDSSNNITMADPIDRPGDWNNNIDFQDIHTQSTRISSGTFGAGAGGGLDDRFDFIMISQNMTSDPTLRYVPDSYNAFGNNGNCYNNDISDASCDGVYGQLLRNSLFSMSDHLPVVMELETDRQIVLSVADMNTSESGFQLQQTMASETLTLLIDALLEPMTLDIYNVLGQRLMTVDGTASEAITIPVAHLANGIYYIKSRVTGSKPLKFLKTS
ncbi:hypothetical protein [Altibacter sp.]|uniref:hypothetical protein n=1 Tax=Altibacter sp. TaxID=2024823 RepID=UPI000C91381D|nr:hypothetical protein [Altibacter sp.]MAP55533.1 hypothetical protein [Altibacter sp.]